MSTPQTPCAARRLLLYQSLTRKVLLEEILLLAMAAVLAGKRSYIAISDWLQDLTPEYRERFGCRPWGSTFKVPSEPTIRRTLPSIDRETFNAVLNA